MRGLFGGFGFGGGGAQRDNRVLTTSGKWLATVIAFFAMIILTPDLWDLLGDWITALIGARYDGVWADIMFWALKLGAYPMVYFSTRMLVGLIFMGTALCAALRLAGSGRPH